MSDDEPTLQEAAAVMAAVVAYRTALDYPAATVRDLRAHCEQLAASIARLASVIADDDDADAP